MASVKIALFTPFSPTIGGGSVIFRSVLPHLAGADVRWFYLSSSPVDAPSSTHLGPPIMGGPPAYDLVNTLRLFALESHPEVDRCVRAIRDWSPDVAWVNAMNEGILVGKKLLDAGIPHLHVSVHDDSAGLAIKSRRYRSLASLMDRRNSQLLRRAHSVDVVCNSMREYYKHRFGVDAGVVYRYIHDLRLPAPRDASAPAFDGPIIRIGHVGSFYNSSSEVFAFVDALRSIAASDGIQFRFENYGGVSAMTATLQAKFPEVVENAGNVPEDEVIRRLQSAAFVYSMYSFNPRHRLFRETSQPTKISTYLMAGRPILAHCPNGSSTIDMLTRFKVGVCVSTMEQQGLIDAIRSILTFALDREEVARAADYYCGPRSIDYLSSCFKSSQRTNLEAGFAGSPTAP
jgi:hypothetical protein